MSRAAIFFVASTSTLPGLPSQKQNQQTESESLTHLHQGPSIYIISIIYLYTSMSVPKTWKIYIIVTSKVHLLMDQTSSSPLWAFEFFGLRLLGSRHLSHLTPFPLSTSPQKPPKWPSTHWNIKHHKSRKVKDLENLRLFTTWIREFQKSIRVHPIEKQKRSAPWVLLPLQKHQYRHWEVPAWRPVTRSSDPIQPNSTYRLLISPRYAMDSAFTPVAALFFCYILICLKLYQAETQIEIM